MWKEIELDIDYRKYLRVCMSVVLLLLKRKHELWKKR